MTSTISNAGAKAGAFVSDSASTQLSCGCAICSGAKLDWLEPIPLLTDGSAVTADDEGDVSVAVGGSFTGTIGSDGDTDIITVTLEAGQTYLISLRGTGETPLVDSYLYFYDPSGVELTSDDDGGTGTNSLITFTATSSGIYEIEAAAYPDSGLTGEYTVDVRQQGADSVPGDLTTGVSLPFGETTFGFLETDGDVDTYVVTLTAGRLYTFEVAGGADYNTHYLAVPPGELDTRLTLFDAAGNEVAFNDDINFSSIPGNGDISSAIGFSATESGTYYLQVDAYEGNSGGYALATKEVDLEALDPLDSIDWGSQLASTEVTVYFAPVGEIYDGVASLGWTDYEIQQAMAAFQTWADVTNLDFTITQDADTATFKLVTTVSADYLGYFWPPGEENAGIGVFAVNGTGWDRTGSDGGLEQGGYGWITLIHEFGHGIGLAHPHDNGGTSEIMAGVTGPFDSFGAFDLNQGVYTTMSYNDGWQTHPDADEDGEIPGAPTGWGYQGGPGAFDIAKVQQKYGADAGRNSGNTIYVLPTENEAGTFWTTIWDVSGIDSIVHNGSVGALIDLTAATLDYSPTGAGVVSYVDGIFGGFTIANGVLIENATGGGGGDVLVGNAAGNIINGRGGADVMVGRGGDDTYFVDNAHDVAEEAAGGGVDSVRTMVTYSLAGQHLEILHLGGVAAINGVGNGLANGLFGNAAANQLYGRGGDDLLRGGYGADRLDGDDGGDRLYGDQAADALFGKAGDDVLDGGPGDDMLRGGYGADDLDGSAGDDRLYGDDGADGLFGEAGDDWLDGGNGHDLLRGGYGADQLDGSAGDDRIYGDEGADLLVGEAGNDWLSGGGDGDLLRGGYGADSLSGGSGTDRLEGGSGADRFSFDTGLGASNVDEILDFSVADDTIFLDRDVFGAIGPDGVLAVSAFRAGTSAADADDRILYDGATGRIFYDADGTGAAAPILFATVDAGLVLTHADFHAFI